MSIVYLNGNYIPMNEARISPMDRGFLFGDGIYEVVPSYEGKLVGLASHLKRMQDGLNSIEIELQIDYDHWQEIALQLIARNGSGNLGLYFQISRGADTKRDHAYPDKVKPTVFIFAYEIPPAPKADKSSATTLSVVTAKDLRWQRCNIKSTSLLGNVMHYQQSQPGGHSETILYNDVHEITEASKSNVYVIKNGIVATPLLDNQKLPGVTRKTLLELLRRDGNIAVEERIVALAELKDADEVWLSSSTRGLVPVIAVDEKPVADGQIGNVWLAAQTLYATHKFDL